MRAEANSRMKCYDVPLIIFIEGGCHRGTMRIKAYNESVLGSGYV